MTPARLRLALAASLLVNVFTVGTIAGGVVVLKRSEVRAPRPPAGRPIRFAGQDLPPADAARFQELMLQVIQNNRDLGRTARMSRRQAAAAFNQPDFDRAAVAALLERGRQADGELRARLETAAVDFAATLPADERATLAIGLERGPLRGARP